MEFLFFDATDKALFTREDAESAQWTVEDMSLVAAFPYDPAKVLQRGQRVGFADETGVFQPFEIRKVENMEPDHYQRITAEHIVISELSDEHCPGAAYTNITAQEALSAQLVGTLWSVGTVTASGTSSADISMGSKWQAVRTIENNWNVYITPRVTFSATGITGRYLDIAPAQPVWRGIRLTLDKNADEAGVTYDDTNVVTAMYGYGRSSTEVTRTVYPAQFELWYLGHALMGDGQGGVTVSVAENWNMYRMALPQRMKIKLHEISANSQVSGVLVAVYEYNSTYYIANQGAEITADALLINYLTTINQYSAASITYTPEASSAALNFGDVVWTTAGGDPANKPAGQTYVEDTAATAAFGRNGRPRYGYYQNGNVSSPETLLALTWQALQQSKEPRLSIDMMVRDLYRLGYADQPIRLHDHAFVEIEPIGLTIAPEIIRLSVDLLDPTATRPTIGSYIPNIIYIERETARRAGGGGGGGGRGQTNREKELSEFETEIAANQYQISLRAYQRDMNNVEDILRQAGISIDAMGVITYATDNANMWQSKLNVQADRIGLVVEGTGENARIRAAQIMLAINGDQSEVYIGADKIFLDGNTTIKNLLTGVGVVSYMRAQSLLTGTLSAGTTTLGSTTIATNGYIDLLTNKCYLQVDEGDFYLGDTFAASWKGKTIQNAITASGPYNIVVDNNGTQSTVSGYIITAAPSSSYINYVGR